MKMRRFTPAGIIAVKAFLADIKASGQLDLVRRDQLLTGPLTEPIPALADLDLDTARIFDTTFAFCEYFDSLIHDHNPQAYRTDVGFWTWLAMAYLPQLVKADKEGKTLPGQESRIVYEAFDYKFAYRHLLATPFDLYQAYRLERPVCDIMLQHPLNFPGDVVDRIFAQQTLIQNPAAMSVLNSLYYDRKKSRAKYGCGGIGPGSVRRFFVVFDQICLTRDFYRLEDACQLLRILPKEFDKYKGFVR